MTSEPVRVTEEIEGDDNRLDALRRLTEGRPYVLLSMDPQATGKLVILLECGGGVDNREALEEFLTTALQHLRSS